MASAFLYHETKAAARARKAAHRAVKESDRSRKNVLKARKQVLRSAERFLSTPLGATFAVMLCAVVMVILAATVVGALN